MASSHDTNISTQRSQLLRGIFQPSITRFYQNPPSAPTNLDRLAELPTISNQIEGASRPHSITELAERVKQSLGDESRPFKAWLRVAENARLDAKRLYKQGDFESAFVEYGKAATVVLEKIPSHPDYRILLSTTQRHNVGLVSLSLIDGSRSLCFDWSRTCLCECLYECVSVFFMLAV